MGLEAKAVAIFNRKRINGKLHVDSNALSFRSNELKWDVLLESVVTAKALEGNLHIQFGKKKIVFEIGKTAPKWVDKVLHPPDRMKKLGIKPSFKVWLSTGFDKSFRDEIKALGAKVTRKLESTDLAIWKVIGKNQLSQFDALTDQLPIETNIWIVWPKGTEAIGQTDVMTKAKSLGFGPSKTAAFDDGHSSMRFRKRV